MNKPKNEKLSEHFTLYEFVEGKALPREAVDLNWQNLNLNLIPRFRELCERLECVRADINERFGNENKGKTVGLQINAGYRCKEWELRQGRSGLSQHTISAVDVYPTNCSKELANKILEYLEKKYWDKNIGWYGGFAVGYGKPKGAYNQGFVHFDIRKSVARWYY